MFFGFGSIINTKSRHKSIKTGDAYPCRISYLKRIWNRYENPHPTNKSKQPNMGTIFTNNKNDTVNGVIYEVNDEMIKAYDERELKWGYTRAILSKGSNHPEYFKKIFNNNHNSSSNSQQNSNPSS